MRDDGGPAFPVPPGHCNTFLPFGMSLRDYFAAMALKAGLSSSFLETAWTQEECEVRIINAAVLSYRLADAMLAERAK